MVQIPAEFDSIRPYTAEELPQMFDRLLANEQFKVVMAHIFPQMKEKELAQTLKSCTTNLEVQKKLVYPFLKNLVKQASKGCTIDMQAIDKNKRHTFISNHRDIVLDSAFLSMLLFDEQCDTTCEIAIGDNLLSLPWVKHLVRVCKAFIVERNLPIRQTLIASKRLSEYIHFVMQHKDDNIWIAQREGRAKDSNDRTQEALLKMLTIGGEGDVIDRLKALRIVPLSISYEFDPCDYLKAQEMQQKRDIADFKKSAEDDVLSMQTGIMGYKGYIHYHCGACINDFLDTLNRNMPKAELFAAVAQHIDQEIYRNYRMYPNNYIAADLLAGSTTMNDHYTEQDQAIFEKYLAGQLDKIRVANRDESFLCDRILEMYANPLKNFLSVR